MSTNTLSGEEKRRKELAKEQEKQRKAKEKQEAAQKKNDEKLVAVLARCVDRAARPLLSAGKNAGLFPGTVAGRAMAQVAESRGFIERCSSPDGTARTATPYARLSENGLRFVLESTSARPVLLELAAVIEDRTSQNTARIQELHDQQTSWQRQAEQLREALQLQSSELRQILQTVKVAVEQGNRSAPIAVAVPATPSPQASPPANQVDLQPEVERFLETRRNSGVAGDCPLPELYDHLRQRRSTLTIGSFHDVLRRLHDENRIRLSGWSGPVTDLPKPDLALLVAHKVMYYARLP